MSVKEYKGSFSKAFADARKAGEKQFRWYNPKTKQIEIFGVLVKPDKADTVVTSRLSKQLLDAIKNNGRLTAKKKEDLKGEYFDAGNLGDLIVTAARTKLNKNTPGFIPVHSRTDVVDSNGYTRVFKDYNTGLFYVIDDYGNIMGRTTDANAANVGFDGFVKTDGTKADILRRAADELTNRANLNEANQLGELADLRSRGLGVLNTTYDNGDMAGAVHEGRQATANTINLAMNLPTHAVYGAIRSALPNNYTWDDYTQGFNVDQFYKPTSLTFGLGDIATDYIDDPTGMLLVAGNVAGNTALLGLVEAKAPRLVKGRGYKSQMAAHNADAVPVLVTERVSNPSHLLVVGKDGKITSNIYGFGNTANKAGNIRINPNYRNKGQVIVNNRFSSLRAKPTSSLLSYTDYAIMPRTGLATNTTSGITSWIGGKYTPELAPAFHAYHPIESTLPTAEILPAKYYYTQGDGDNSMFWQGHANAWNSDLPYIPSTTNGSEVTAVRSILGDSPYYTERTWGTAKDSKLIPISILRTGGKLIKRREQSKSRNWR